MSLSAVQLRSDVHAQPSSSSLLTSNILGEIATGSREAFASLYLSGQPDLVRYASALLAGDTDAALDVVHEAFLNIWRQAGRYSGAGNADGWIRRIVRNKAVDWLRSRRERPVATDAQALGEVADDADTPERAMEKSCQSDELRAALQRLTPRHREVVWLCYFEDRSLSEIALIAGCPENTVKTRLFHARRILRDQLERSQAE